MKKKKEKVTLRTPARTQHSLISNHSFVCFSTSWFIENMLISPLYILFISCWFLALVLVLVFNLHYNIAHNFLGSNWIPKFSVVLVIFQLKNSESEAGIFVWFIRPWSCTAGFHANTVRAVPNASHILYKSWILLCPDDASWLYGISKFQEHTLVLVTS